MSHRQWPQKVTSLFIQIDTHLSSFLLLFLSSPLLLSVVPYLSFFTSFNLFKLVATNKSLIKHWIQFCLVLFENSVSFKLEIISVFAVSFPIKTVSFFIRQSLPLRQQYGNVYSLFMTIAFGRSVFVSFTKNWFKKLTALSMVFAWFFLLFLSSWHSKSHQIEINWLFANEMRTQDYLITKMQ